MKKRLVAALLALALLSGCGSRPAQLPPAAEAPPEIAYVPLDDRPDNVERPIYLAESLGYRLSQPPLDHYRTRLAGQPKNENGSQFGDREALISWVLEREAGGCDRYILFLDQLLSGGLVNSRSLHNEPEAELGWLESLLGTLGSDPRNQVWLLDSVMRLAPTVGYDHWEIAGYNALRAYGMEPRPELAGEALTPGAIEAGYRLGADSRELSPGAFDLEPWEVEEYLSARSRKLQLSTKLMELVEQKEQFHVLFGIDDSAEEDSIQKNEIAYLRSLLRPGDALLSGVDDLAFKAITKLYLQESNWQGATAAVQYFGGREGEAACAYDYQPLQHIVAEHLDFFGLQECADPQAAELQILVLTQPAEEARKEHYCEELVKALRENRKSHRPTVLIDAGNGRYGNLFHRMLTKKTELGWLLSYAGFLDMAIVTGTALSHGVARYAFLQQGRRDSATEAAFARTLTDSIVKDFCYKNEVREPLLQYVRNELGGSPDNFWVPPLELDALQSFLETRMEESSKPVLRNLERSAMISGLAPYEELGWGTLTLSHYRFPWDRAFEIGMDIEVGSFREKP